MSTPGNNPGSWSENRPIDPGLQAVIETWPTLPEPMRAGIAARVKAQRT